MTPSSGVLIPIGPPNRWHGALSKVGRGITCMEIVTPTFEASKTWTYIYFMRCRRDGMEGNFLGILVVAPANATSERADWVANSILMQTAEILK